MKGIKIFVLAMGLLLFSQVTQADWITSKRLTWTSGGSEAPAIATDSSNTIHVVWSDDTPGNYEIHYKRSADGGTTWSTAKRLTWSSGYSSLPAIAIDSVNNIHVVWSDDIPGNYEIHYKRSADGGTTWSVAKRLTWTSGYSNLPAIAIDSANNIHIVWQDDEAGFPEIYYKRSADGGTTWSTAKRLTWTSGYSFAPVIAIGASDTIHVVWSDYTPDNYEIYYKRSTDGGTTWSADKRLTWTSGTSYEPIIAIDLSNTIHVVWYDYTPGFPEIYYKSSPDGGTTWSTVKRLTWTSGSSSSPTIAIDSNNTIHVVWSDSTPGNYEIYYKNSTDGGATWTSVQRLTMTSGLSGNPAIDVDSSGNLHVVWDDDTPGNAEIYYKKGAGKTPVVQPGEWTATADFGTFDFVVSPDSQYITEITYKFSNFSCGGIILNGGLSISTSPGWPISNLSFEIENYLDPAHNQLFTVQGTFSNSGNQASGTWEAEFYGSTCSGSWQGSPKT